MESQNAPVNVGSSTCRCVDRGPPDGKHRTVASCTSVNRVNPTSMRSLSSPEPPPRPLPRRYDGGGRDRRNASSRTLNIRRHAERTRIFAPNFRRGGSKHRWPTAARPAAQEPRRPPVPHIHLNVCAGQSLENHAHSWRLLPAHTRAAVPTSRQTANCRDVEPSALVSCCRLHQNACPRM